MECNVRTLPTPIDGGDVEEWGMTLLRARGQALQGHHKHLRQASSLQPDHAPAGCCNAGPSTCVSNAWPMRFEDSPPQSLSPTPGCNSSAHRTAGTPELGPEGRTAAGAVAGGFQVLQKLLQHKGPCVHANM